MTGEIISGEQAGQLGLATGVDADPNKLADELIDAIIARSPDSVASGKKLLNDARRGSVRSVLARERWAQLAMFRTRNAGISRKAGMKGEPPVFGPRTYD